MNHKVALITGASRGIGKAVSRYFAGKQYRLALIARHSEGLNNLRQELQQDYPDLIIDCHAQDISNAKETYALVTSIAHETGRLDVVFNNAGLALFGCSELPIDKLEKMLAVNVAGCFAVAKAAAEVMKAQSSGYLFNVSSMAGKRGLAAVGGYSASKFAVTGLGQALFQELTPRGIKVTTLCPSVVDTDMTRAFSIADEDKITLNDMVKSVDYCLSLSPNALIDSLEIRCKAIST